MGWISSFFQSTKTINWVFYTIQRILSQIKTWLWKVCWIFMTRSLNDIMQYWEGLVFDKFIYLFYLFIYLFIYLCIYLFIHLLINFFFPFSIKNTTNNKTQELYIYIRKIKRKSNPQPKTESLPNLHLAVPRQHINFKNTYFWVSFWSNCTVSETEKEEWHF